MKKKIIKILGIVLTLIIVSTIGILFYKNVDKKNKKIIEEKKQERYSEIKETVKKGVEWNVKATYPKCKLIDEVTDEKAGGIFYNSSFLIENGYINQKDLLDYDEESYCDVYVDIKSYFEDPLNHQHNCSVSYKLYLKCNGYEEEGYVYWSH